MTRAAPAPVAVALALALGCAAAPAGPVSDGRYLMGTVLEIELHASDTGAGREALERLFARARRIERALTRFDPESDLSRLNARAGQGPQRVGPELAAALDAAIRYGRATRGAFDPSVGPLVELWWAAAERGRRPDPAELAAARARVGLAHLRADPEAGTAEVAAGVAVDLGGLGKGYALDALVPELESAGIDTALLSFGQSSIHAVGAPPGADAWRVLVWGAGGGPADVVRLRDRALSVSGSLGQSFEIEGRRYGHVIDPVRGEPLAARRLAAVVADSGARAEALSTALVVLGPEGIGLIDSMPGAEALLVDEGGARWQTSGWRDLAQPS